MMEFPILYIESEIIRVRNLKILSAVVLTVLSVILSSITLGNKMKILNILSPENSEQTLQIPNWLRVILCILIGAGGFLTTWMLYKNCSLTINIIRLQIAYVCMAGAACVDLREHRIPNIFPAVMSLAGIVCIALLYFTDSDGSIAYIISSLAGTVLCAVCMLIIYAITKGGIGMGDIKLFCALSLLGGANALGCTAAVGAISCGLVTIVLLLLKKKNAKKDALPFAPFAFLGFTVSVLLPIA